MRERSFKLAKRGTFIYVLLYEIPTQYTIHNTENYIN